MVTQNRFSESHSQKSAGVQTAGGVYYFPFTYYYYFYFYGGSGVLHVGRGDP